MVFPLMAIGLGLGAAGAVSSFIGAQQTQRANKDAIAAQQRMLDIQQQANQIDADRRRRQLIREGVISRATALARATAQGATGEGGSALGGAYGQIAGRTAFGITGVNQAEDTSNQLYAANQDLFKAKLAANDATSYTAMRQGLSSLGGALLSNMSAIGNLTGGQGMSYGNTLVDPSGRLYNSGAGAPYA